MVNAPALGLAALLALGLPPAPDASPRPAPELDPNRAVGKALGKGSFPWYDAENDRARPVRIPQQPRLPEGWDWSLPGLGQLMTLLGFGVALAALIGVLAWLWRIYEPVDNPEGRGQSRDRGGPSRIESLPAGLRREIESSDPWEEALRRRGRGDLAGAVVCLFAHQLLTLSRLGLVRLGPGRTGRQLLRSVVDAEFRNLVHPTLRLFESVYYGHRPPTSEEFATLWAKAEAFERRVAGGVVA